MLIEIELEAAHGWCKNIPTAKNVIGTFTLYHIYMMIFMTVVISMIFIPRFVIACQTSEFTPWSAVCHFLFYLLAWFLIEDFLWFVLNPYYTIQKYTQKNIPWHTKWIMGIPVHNIVGILGLAALAFIEHTWSLWIALAVFTVLLILTCFVSPSYHALYWQLHGKSDPSAKDNFTDNNGIKGGGDSSDPSCVCAAENEEKEHNT